MWEQVLHTDLNSCFKILSCCVVSPGLELLILLPQLPKSLWLQEQTTVPAGFRIFIKQVLESYERSYHLAVAVLSNFDWVLVIFY